MRGTIAKRLRGIVYRTKGEYRKPRIMARLRNPFQVVNVHGGPRWLYRRVKRDYKRYHTPFQEDRTNG